MFSKLSFFLFMLTLFATFKAIKLPAKPSRASLKNNRSCGIQLKPLNDQLEMPPRKSLYLLFHSSSLTHVFYRFACYLIAFKLKQLEISILQMLFALSWLIYRFWKTYLECSTVGNLKYFFVGSFSLIEMDCWNSCFMKTTLPYGHSYCKNIQS